MKEKLERLTNRLELNTGKVSIISLMQQLKNNRYKKNFVFGGDASRLLVKVTECGNKSQLDADKPDTGRQRPH